MPVKIRSTFDRELATIRDDILRLGSLVRHASERALKAFQSHNITLAQAVVSDDDIIDELHQKVEQEVAVTMARQQPIATDLRFLIAALLISNELERMGDHAAGVAKTVLLYQGASMAEVPVPLSDMQGKVSVMIDRAMDAFVERSPDKARETAQLDDQLDALYQQLFKQIVGSLQSGSLPVEHGMYILWAGHSLERIGDRVTNICERVIYSRTGDVDDLNPKPDQD